MEIIKNKKLSPIFFGEDCRGYSIKNFEYYKLESVVGKFEIKEILHIFCKQNTLRGLHYQYPHYQKRIVTCVMGEVFLAIVNVEVKSSEYGVTNDIVLKCGESFVVDEGWALGTYALVDSMVCILANERFYEGEGRGVFWRDPSLKIDWPFLCDEVVISNKDKMLKGLQTNVSLQENIISQCRSSKSKHWCTCTRQCTYH